VVKYFWLEINGEDAFDYGERDVHATITRPRLNEVLKTEDSAVFSVFCFAGGSTKVMIEGVDEALSSSGIGGVQSFPEPEDGVSLVTGVDGMNLAYSRANLAKSVPSSQEGPFKAFMNESDIARVPFPPSSSL